MVYQPIQQCYILCLNIYRMLRQKNAHIYMHRDRQEDVIYIYVYT